MITATIAYLPGIDLSVRHVGRPCDSCGTEFGPTWPNGRPVRVEGKAVGLEGKICRTCYREARDRLIANERAARALAQCCLRRLRLGNATEARLRQTLPLPVIDPFVPVESIRPQVFARLALRAAKRAERGRRRLARQYRERLEVVA